MESEAIGLFTPETLRQSVRGEPHVVEREGRVDFDWTDHRRAIGQAHRQKLLAAGGRGVLEHAVDGEPTDAIEALSNDQRTLGLRNDLGDRGTERFHRRIAEEHGTGD